MKKILFATILMLSANFANAGFWSGLSFFKPTVVASTKTLPPPNPAPETIQKNTEENVYTQAIKDHEEGGYKEQEEGNVGAVPVPAALPLMASALCIFGIARRRNINK